MGEDRIEGGAQVLWHYENAYAIEVYAIAFDVEVFYANLAWNSDGKRTLGVVGAGRVLAASDQFPLFDTDEQAVRAAISFITNWHEPVYIPAGDSGTPSV